ncbi:MAG: hypothetical protein O7C59_08000 [Rickettsia endosymbiont of Ixodes persulcatus]|nr:hypothetical protein [Rickettsia endosymbiont of Ixodes persulcatus]
MVFLWPEQEYQEQGQAGKTVKQESVGDGSLSLLFGFGIWDGSVVFFEDGFDVVDPAVEFDELVVGYLGELLVGGVFHVIFVVVTHACDSIYMAVLMIAIILMIQAVMFLGAGLKLLRL